MFRLRLFSPLLVTAALLAIAVTPATAVAQQAYAYQNVFNDDSGLTLSAGGANGGVGWQVDNTPAVPSGSPASGGNNLNYNDGVDYDNGSAVTGTARTPTINLTGAQSATMSFWCRYQTETTGTGYDQRWIRIYNATTNAQVYQLQFYQSGSGESNCPSMSSWHQHTWANMPAAALNIPIVIEFYFSSGDNFGNNYQGWFVDDLVIVSADVNPPQLIDDLTGSNPTLSGCTLEWTAPADDDLAGKAASFDLRYSTNPITDANFGQATLVNGEPSPGAPGTLHTVAITGLAPGTDYYFAIRSTDPAGNTSAISNVAQVSTVALPPVGGSATTAPTEPEDKYAYCGVGLAGSPSGLLALSALLVFAGAGRRFLRRR